MGVPQIRRLYYPAKEACEHAGISQKDLRRWEKKFPHLKPSRSRTGRRLYKPRDLEILKLIKRLKDADYSDMQIALHLDEHVRRTFDFDTINTKLVTRDALFSEVFQGLKEILSTMDEMDHRMDHVNEQFHFNE